MARKSKEEISALVLEHLEDVSWNILAEYPKVIQKMIRGRSGLYALYKREKIYYVGLASNLMGRLNTHLRDRHKEKWERFSVYLLIQTEHKKELESLILRIVDLPGNRKKGKFLKSNNLQKELFMKMCSEDADKRARLLGGQIARKRRRAKTHTRQFKLQCKHMK